jgi:hypothetical protein
MDTSARRRLGHFQILVDGSAADSHLAGDIGGIYLFAEQVMDLVIALDLLLMKVLALLLLALAHACIPGRKLLCLLLRHFLRWLLHKRIELCPLVEKKALHGFGKIRKQMPAVGNLLRLRCSLSGSIRIGATAIAADDLHSCMSLEPLLQGGSFAIRQNIDRNPSL